EGVAPAGAVTIDGEREFPARLVSDDFGTCLPGFRLGDVSAREPGIDAAGVVFPPALLADRAPLAHAGDVGHHCVKNVGGCGDGHGLGTLAVAHGQSLWRESMARVYAGRGVNC